MKSDSNTTCFQTSFSVAGIMCLEGCGVTIEDALSEQVKVLKKQKLIPNDAIFKLDSEPESLGVHCFTIILRSSKSIPFETNDSITKKLKESINELGFQVIDHQLGEPIKKYGIYNWINIIINLLAILGVFVFSFIFPPSLFLTIGLTAFTVLVTAFTARKYLYGFIKDIMHFRFASMSVPVTLGWISTMGHTLYHTLSMPLVMNLSMVWMCFAMPIVLITMINVMDEVKRIIANKTQKMNLKRMKDLFPNMENTYDSYLLSKDLTNQLSQVISQGKKQARALHDLNLSNTKLEKCDRRELDENMVICVKRGQNFPADGTIIQGNTFVDTSIINGEPKQFKQSMDDIPAGALNLSTDVIFFIRKKPYFSTINQLLFRAGAIETKTNAQNKHKKFTYLYATLIAISIIATVAVPFAFGIVTVPLLLQNIGGLLMAICPCTLVIAHALPKILFAYENHKQGVVMRSEDVQSHGTNIHTIIFDKTGTLTTGKSQVDSIYGDISEELLQRVAALENQYGAGHPIAEAIKSFYEIKLKKQTMNIGILSPEIDHQGQGLSANVAGKLIHIGNEEYLKKSGIKIMNKIFKSDFFKKKVSEGCTPIYIAEENKLKGVIFIQHEIRKEVLADLRYLKSKGKKIILLTGDTSLSSKYFNEQCGEVFDESDIYTSQTPMNKEAFLKELVSKENIDPRGICFIGDGLNDTSAINVVNTNGGLTCSMTDNDNARFFTKICLSGSLRYICGHEKLHKHLRRNIIENQGLLIFGILTFLIFMIGFSFVGLAVSPMLPLSLMTISTLMVFYNTYRVKWFTSQILDKKNTSWLKNFMAADFSTALLFCGFTILASAVLVSTLATGGLSLPIIGFSLTVLTSINNLCVIASTILFGIFGAAAGMFFLNENLKNKVPSILFNSKNKQEPSIVYHVDLEYRSPKSAGKNSLEPIVSNDDKFKNKEKTRHEKRIISYKMNQGIFAETDSLKFKIYKLFRNYISPKGSYPLSTFGRMITFHINRHHLNDVKLLLEKIRFLDDNNLIQLEEIIKSMREKMAKDTNCNLNGSFLARLDYALEIISIEKQKNDAGQEQLLKPITFSNLSPAC